uniref:SAUR-like auxin-responsive protein family n=1 Tax=Zea mays TaxID=4577 RepID=A0A804LE12_MAIZE
MVVDRWLLPKDLRNGHVFDRWRPMSGRQQAASLSPGGRGEEEATGLPSDVPRDHFAVYVGERRRRFVVPITLLDRPEFRYLLRRAKEEFTSVGGALILPCEEVAFHSLTSALACAR